MARESLSAAIGDLHLLDLARARRDDHPPAMSGAHLQAALRRANRRSAEQSTKSVLASGGPTTHMVLRPLSRAPSPGLFRPTPRRSPKSIAWSECLTNRAQPLAVAAATAIAVTGQCSEHTQAMAGGRDRMARTLVIGRRGCMAAMRKPSSRSSSIALRDGAKRARSNRFVKLATLLRIIT